MKKQPTYSSFKAKVYKITAEKKTNYVYYEWKPEKGGRSWSKTGTNGKPYRWAVPNTEEGDKAYNKFSSQIEDCELVETKNGVNVFPPVEFDVTMKRHHRGKFQDEYVWTFSHRITPKPEMLADIFEEKENG